MKICFNLSDKLKLKTLVFLFLLILAASYLGVQLAPNSFLSQNPSLQSANIDRKQKTTENVLVKRVIDGDTFETISGKKVRLIGIDAPELHPKKECMGEEAKDFLQGKIEGKKVLLKKDKTNTDKYGRLLRYVYLKDEFINQSLAEKGLAKAKSYPPNTSLQEALKKAQKYAKENKLGIYSSVCKESFK